MTELDARVLVADDDPVNRLLLERSLTNEGCAVTTVEDGMQALRRLRSSPDDFDLVLLDVMMPGLDGYEVLRYLKGDPALAHLPVVVVSAIDDIASVVKCLELGADDYLAKPFNAVLLRARLNSSLARKRHSDAERRYVGLIEEEGARSNQLVLNILPAAVAERLKRGESVIADAVDDVSVVFADIVGFTALAARRSAADVVKLLNEIVSSFDEMMWVYGFEKIKTIGDAYLAAGGLTAPSDDHVARAVELGFAMLDQVAGLTHPVDLRVGIHTGPVVAGVIGSHKFSYDIWGDTVNLASRMESHGLPGRVHVSEAVRDRLEGRFGFESRGQIEIKSRGTMSTFFVDRPAGRPEGPDTSPSRPPRAQPASAAELVRRLRRP